MDSAKEIAAKVWNELLPDPNTSQHNSFANDPVAQKAFEIQAIEICDIFQRSDAPFMELQDHGEVTKPMSGVRNLILEKIFEDSAKLNGQGSMLMSCADVEQAALLLSDEVIFLYKKLNDILATSEQSIQKTLMKWTEKKKRAILLEAYPEIPTRHRPDFDCLYGKWSSMEQKNDQIYLTPLLNLEDLLRGNNLLLLISSRGHCYPGEFAHADWQDCRLGWALKKLMPIRLPGYKMMLDSDDNKPYGRVIADPAVISGADLNANPDILQTPGSFDPGHGTLVLHAQKQILRFLVRVCELLLSGKHIVPDSNMQSNPTVLHQNLEPDSFVTMKIESAYRVPAQLNLQLLLELIVAKKDEAEDNVQSLREDPKWFFETMNAVHAHREESLPDRTRNAHPRYKTEKYYNDVQKQVLEMAYGPFIMWTMIANSVMRILDLENASELEGITHKDLSMKYQDAKQGLQDVLCSASQMYLNQLKKIYKASPNLRSKFVRVDDGKTSTTYAVPKSRNKDRLIFLLREICQYQLVSFIHLPILVDEITHILRDDAECHKISPLVLEVISNLEFVCQLQQDLRVYKPVNPFTSLINTSTTDHFSKDIRHELETMLADVYAGFQHIHVSEQLLPLRRFDVDVDKLTAKNTEAIIKAEDDLATVFEKIDRRFKKNTGRSLEESLHANFTSIRAVRRTTPWQDPVIPQGIIKKSVADASVPSGFVPDFGEEKVGSFKPEKPKEQKRKTTGDAAPLALNPDVHDMNIEVGQETRIAVKARSMKLFQTIFYDPNGGRRSGNVRWADFVFAMTDAGFSIKGTGGSEWLFKPVKFGPVVNMTIHDYHKAEFPLWRARQAASRMHDKYGWTLETFSLAEK